MTLLAKAHELAIVALCLAYPALVIAGLVALVRLVPALQRLASVYPP